MYIYIYTHMNIIVYLERLEAWTLCPATRHLGAPQLELGAELLEGRDVGDVTGQRDARIAFEVLVRWAHLR